MSLGIHSNMNISSNFEPIQIKEEIDLHLTTEASEIINSSKTGKNNKYNIPF